MIYDQYPSINSLSIKNRIEAFRETTLELIQQGKTIEEIKKDITFYQNEEAYEVIDGIFKAIEDFKKVPQTKLL